MLKSNLMYLVNFSTLIINETQHVEFLSNFNKNGTWECNYLNATLLTVLLPRDTSSENTF